MLMRWILPMVVIAQAHAAGLDTPSLPDSSKVPEQIIWHTTNAYPHDEQASTQGLAFDAGYLYESTGLFGHSSVRKIRLDDGTLLASSMLGSKQFGEGLALHDGQLYQLTWRSGTGFRYDPDELFVKGEFHYGGEGWGLTSDGKHLILSDGGAKLQFLDPDNLKPSRTLEVKDQYGPVMRLNELEYIDGEIFANVLYENRIARIDAKTGQVTGWLDLQAIAEQPAQTGVDASKSKVMNGIAWDAAQRRLLVTGKHWPQIYEIRFGAKPDQ